MRRSFCADLRCNNSLAFISSLLCAIVSAIWLLVASALFLKTRDLSRSFRLSSKSFFMDSAIAGPPVVWVGLPVLRPR